MYLNFISLDLPPLLTALFSSLACALLGNFLVLRRLSLMGDALSHSVLPGIVLAFIIFNTRGGFLLFAGAAFSAVLATIMIETIKRLTHIESGAAMGVIFSTFFALGVLLLETGSLRNVDLDAECVLHGQLETVIWLTPEFSLLGLSNLPTELITTGIAFLIIATITKVFFKEFTLVAFDPLMASSIGYNSTFLHYFQMILIASAVVASFEAVGSILVIGALICPSATARLLTDNMKGQIGYSIAIATISVISGYILANVIPILLGTSYTLNTAGCITVVSGLNVGLALIFSPKYGIRARRRRQLQFAAQIVEDDVLGILFRYEEDQLKLNTFSDLFPIITANQDKIKVAVQSLENKKLIIVSSEISLTVKGRDKAKELVKSHRLWESYFAGILDLPKDHVHESAELLEHFTDQPLQERLLKRQDYPKLDPHGKKIPR
jgi:manganese/zinc/iron transport system permease protein